MDKNSYRYDVIDDVLQFKSLVYEEVYDSMWKLENGIIVYVGLLFWHSGMSNAEGGWET